MKILGLRSEIQMNFLICSQTVLSLRMVINLFFDKIGWKTLRAALTNSCKVLLFGQDSRAFHYLRASK